MLPPACRRPIAAQDGVLWSQSFAAIRDLLGGRSSLPLTSVAKEPCREALKRGALLESVPYHAGDKFSPLLLPTPSLSQSTTLLLGQGEVLPPHLFAGGEERATGAFPRRGALPTVCCKSLTKAANAGVTTNREEANESHLSLACIQTSGPFLQQEPTYCRALLSPENGSKASNSATTDAAVCLNSLLTGDLGGDQIHVQVIHFQAFSSLVPDKSHTGGENKSGARAAFPFFGDLLLPLNAGVCPLASSSCSLPKHTQSPAAARE